MEALHGVINSLNTVLWSYVLIVLLIGIGVWFTLRTKLVQVRMLPEMLRLLTEGVGSKTEGEEISTFQAFCVSTASRVGVGNIAGVAIAIVTGGPGAVFWMWLIAFIGCATGFVESTLAQIYKLPHRLGAFHGGPAYYIQNALKKPALAKLFAILISVTFGLIYNSVQANTIALSVESAFGIGHIPTGILLCILTGLVIFGGMTRIARVAEVLVPVMAVLYLLTALVTVVLYIDQVPAMFYLIFHDAFNPQAAVGGGLGTAILTGVKRGLFSNEAGEGSVPNAAATATTSHPAKQGLVQSFGVYVDTWIVCSATAFIVLLNGQYTVGGKLTGIALAQESLASTFGSFAPAALAIVIFMFAFSSIVGNYYYGEINIAFFKGNTKQYLMIFRCCVIAMVLFGSLAELSLVWDMADLFMAFLCLTNLFAIAQLGKYAFIVLNDYVRQKSAGIKEPTFDPAILPDETGIYAWGLEKERKI